MVIKRYRKKPVEIRAIEWNGLKEQRDAITGVTNRQAKFNDDNSVIIPTLEGDHKADLGDMIIIGIKDEVYPCKPDIFELTYDIIE